MISVIIPVYNVEKHLEKMLSFSPEKIVLGCTHYPFLINILNKLAKKEMFINPAQKFAKLIKDDLITSNLINKSSHFEQEFYVSKDSKNFVNASKMFYPVEKLPKIINL